MSLIKDFRTFVLRGNVVDLAVGIVIGAAFGAVVTSAVKDLITPLVGIAGKFDFSSLHFTVNHSVFLLGDFLNAVLSFFLLAAVVFFFVVKPVNKLTAVSKRTSQTVAPTEKTCDYCFSSININATRCPNCTSDLKLDA